VLITPCSECILTQLASIAAFLFTVHPEESGSVFSKISHYVVKKQQSDHPLALSFSTQFSKPLLM